jgi:D-serine deaminase-like pyridoxal phosphate-dependent protein
MFPELLTPTILVDLDRLEANIHAMQAVCDAAQVELRPHIKTHKMVEVARRQLRAGAAGLTCAKLGEAEAMLPAFEGLNKRREIFVAHSLVDPNVAPRLQHLHEALDELVIACTSEAHAPILENVVARSGLRLPVMMALDSGLGREGARGVEGAVRLAQCIASQPHLELRGLYTHEGHFYSSSFAESENQLHHWHEALLETHAAIQSTVQCAPLLLWPGCSVSARRVAQLPGISAVRPGSYVMGDISLTHTTGVITPEDVALNVLVSVVDRPAAELALIDAGSKTLSSDRTAQGIFAQSEYGPVTRVSEEHGFITGAGANDLTVGQRLRLVTAHVCPVVNLADTVTVVQGEEVVDCWRVDARGKVQ